MKSEKGNTQNKREENMTRKALNVQRFSSYLVSYYLNKDACAYMYSAKQITNRLKKLNIYVYVAKAVERYLH